MGQRIDKSGECALCGLYRQVLCRDRIIPGRQGGKYEPGNIQWLCANCHQDKSAREQSAAHKGRPKSPEQRAKMSAWQMGIPKPQATREKISATLTGHKQSPESVAKRVAKLRGRVFTAEHRAKISAALKGRATRRKSHCPQGHEYTPTNTLVEKCTGKWVCRACRSDRKKAKRMACAIAS